MARSFNVSTVFTAINRLNAPVAAMGRQISAFASSVRTSSTFASSSLGSVGAAASSAAMRISHALNSITFSGLQSRLASIRSHLQNLSSSISNAGNNLMGLGAGGIAAGYGVSKTLDPVRIAETQRARMGTLYNPKGTVEEKLATGKQHEEAIAQMAIKLPGEAKDFVNFAALLKNYKVDYSENLFRDFTDLAGGAGVKIDDLFMEQITSMLAGNRNALDDKWGLKSGSEGGFSKLTELATGKAHTFKTKADEIAFLREWSKHQGYTGMTEATMKGTEGMESNVADVLANTSKKVWEDSGALDLYKSKIVEFTEACNAAIKPLTQLAKPIAEWAKNNKELFNVIAVGIPGLIALGAALKFISFTLTPFAALFSVTGIALAALGAGAYYVFQNWDKFKDYVPTFDDIKNSIENIGKGFDAICSSISSAHTAIKDFTDAHPILTKFIGTFAAITAGVVLLPQIIGLAIVAFAPIMTIGSVIAASFAAIPAAITAIVGAFSVLTAPVLVAILLFTELVAFQPELNKLGQDFGSGIFNGVQRIKAAWADFVTMMTTPVPITQDLGKDLGSAMFDGVQVAKTAWSDFISLLKLPAISGNVFNTLNSVIQNVKTYWSDFVTMMTTPFDVDFSGISNTFNSVIGTVKSFWADFKTWVTTPLEFNFDTLSNTFNSILNTVKNYWESFKTWILTPIDFSKLWDSLATSFGNAISNITSMWSSVKLGNITPPAIKQNGASSAAITTVPKVAPPTKPNSPSPSALSESRNKFLQPVSYSAPEVNVNIEQSNTHNVSNSGVKTTSLNKVSGGNLKFNNNTKTGAGRRTNPNVANGIYNA